MKKLEEIDKNLAVETEIQREGLTFYNIEQAPFRLHGIFKENDLFRRIPDEVASRVSEGVRELNGRPAGGRVRFVTDSPYVAIKAKCVPYRMSHHALSGSCGFDMYIEYDEENRYAGTFIPPRDMKREYESVIDFEVDGEKVVTINFPLYSMVNEVLVGIKEGAVLKEAPDYKFSVPVVYYGSSITQGGCASKPGGTYQSILSRRFECDYINLGFSGSAKGEDVIREYIQGMDMSVFVLDYDHNAPTVEHLAATHSKMFDAVRVTHPDIPIVIMPRPKYYLTEEEKQRHDVVYQTYKTAKDKGDQNVYFISGRKLMELAGDNGTIDNCHPTDSGFLSMAYAVGEVFKEIFCM